MVKNKKTNKKANKKTKLPRKLSLKAKDGRIILVAFTDIILVKMRNGLMNVMVRNEKEQFIVDGSLTNFEALTKPLGIFCRIHKGCIINVLEVKHYYKKPFYAQLSNNSNVDFSRDGFKEFLNIQPPVSFK